MCRLQPALDCEALRLGSVEQISDFPGDCCKGTYVSVEPFHLFRYLDEQAFRFNNRQDLDDRDRFDLAVPQVIGKRLTFADVTGNSESKTCQN